MVKRAFDLIVSFFLLILLSPLFIIIALLIKFDSKGSVFFIQQRVGKNNQDFSIYKFRTMFTVADRKQQITIGNHDPRITRVGYFLRRFKLDELPQLINVFIGNMSLVGPRPEVRKYVSLYNNEQLKVLTLKPGITDYASIEYSNENELLANVVDPEKKYIDEIMPAKLKLNLMYIQDQSMLTDLKIIFGTAAKIFLKA